MEEETLSIIVNNVNNCIIIVEKWLKDSETKLRVKEDYEKMALKHWKPKEIEKKRIKKVGKLIEIDIETNKEKDKESHRIGCFGRYKANKSKGIKYPGIISLFTNLFQF